MLTIHTMHGSTDQKSERDNEIEGLNIGINPYSGFTPGIPVFTHYTSARRRYSPKDW